MSQPSAEPAGPPHCYRHPGRETYIRCSRCERPICPDCMNDASVGFQCPECVDAGARSGRAARTVLGAEVRRGAGSEVVTRTLVGLQVLAYALVAVAGDPARVALGLIGSGVADGSRVGVAAGQLWRLVTSSLVPRDVLSLLFAVLLTYLLGRQLEAEIGRVRLAVMWVTSAVVGNAAVLVALPPPVLDLGGPAATFGLLVAVVVVGRRLRSDLSGLVVLGALWLVLSLLQRAPDWPGPIAGAVAGGVLAAALAYAPTRRRSTAFTLTAGLLLALGVAVGVAAAGR